MPTNVILPRIDSAMMEGTIQEWKKKEGDPVSKGDVLYILETEKVTFEVEAEIDGILEKIFYREGDSVQVGMVVAVILQPGENASDITDESASRQYESTQMEEETVPSNVAKNEVRTRDKPKKTKATPAAKRMAKELNIDITQIEGSGPGGRINKEDVEKYVSFPKAPETPQEPIAEEIKELSSMRRTIARRMSESFQSTPHFFLASDVDMSELIVAREKLLPSVATRSKNGVRLTFTDLFVAIIAAALEEHPEINVSWAEGSVRIRQEVNIGIAVNLENGLVVPVMRNVNRKKLYEIADVRAALVEKARTGKLMPDDMRGGSLTITNLGMYGIDRCYPIINPPESCILGFGRIREVPVVCGAEIRVSSVMTVSLAVDHRVLDGAMGSDFLKRIKELMENPLLVI